MPKILQTNDSLPNIPTHVFGTAGRRFGSRRRPGVARLAMCCLIKAGGENPRGNDVVSRMVNFFDLDERGMARVGQDYSGAFP